MRLHPGETEAVGWRVMTTLDVVRQLRHASPGVTRRPRMIAIDGRGGAGKTTLVERLSRMPVPSTQTTSAPAGTVIDPGRSWVIQG